MADNYKLREIFVSEMFGMWMVIVMAIGAVANHVLNPTTGKGMGYGFIAVSFGFAFAFPLIAFGSISAMLNPAAALSMVAAGNLGLTQFWVTMAGEMLGAFLGAITVYIMYAPQLHKAGAKVFNLIDLRTSLASVQRGKENTSHLTSKASAETIKDVEVSMAPKDQVREVVNPVSDLSDDDDPFLGIFVTRPAVWNPFTCFFTEFVATFIFLFLVNLLSARGQYLYQPSFGLYANIIQPVLIGFIICAMILCTGPTGFAGNPARDLGPRIAHALLPILKNPRIGSEWWYAWVPVLAPLCGGAAAGGLYRGWVTILKGQVKTDPNPFATNALGNSSVVASGNASAIAVGLGPNDALP